MLRALPLSLLLAASQLFRPATAIDCKKIRIDGKYWNIHDLAGDHEVADYDKDAPGGAVNTTYAFNLCKTIERHDDNKFRHGCPSGAWACAFQTIEKKDEEDERHSWPIAGSFETTSHGSSLDDKQYSLSGSDSHDDKDKEGLRLIYHGGRAYSSRDPAMMIVELICKRDDKKQSRRDDEEDKKEKAKKGKPELVSYAGEGTDGKNSEVLRLKWETPYACEGGADGDDGGEKKTTSGWGFFTWVFIVLFLLVAAYLIFGSWLNYSRHGARGWDLLPHGDTIRDIPYLLKDWGRRMVDTVKGDNRGGYNQI